MPLPPFNPQDAQKIAAFYYGLEAEAVELPGELDRNFLLTASQSRFVLKIGSPARDHTSLDFENQALFHLHDFPGVPRLVPAKSGKIILPVEHGDGQVYLTRLLTYLPGRLLAHYSYHSPALLRHLGEFIANLDLALADFTHPAMRRDLPWDLTRAGEGIQAHLHAIPDQSRRGLVAGFLEGFESRAAPLLPGLRGQVIHNDANDYNLLVENERISGILDFGDMLHAPRVCEPAIAAAYAMLGKVEPLAAAVRVIAGYHGVNPLDEAEIDLLYDLICARLSVSAAMAAQRAQSEPENEYHQISTRPAWEALEKLSQIHPRFACYTFRAACGLAPCPQTAGLVGWLDANREKFTPVMEPDLLQRGESPPAVFDLSVSSPVVAQSGEDAQVFTQKLFGIMEQSGVRLGIGRYNEARLIYSAEMFEVPTDNGSERRTLHLGMDLFAAPGRRVYAPLDGVVHSFRDNHAPQDYGPTIILEHSPPGAPSFFTLYGHLSRASLDGLYIGEPIHAGAPIGRIGECGVNGGWPPHLHFQIITDLLGQEGEFPGVARPSERAVWLSLCPHPGLILNLPDQLPSQPGKGAEAILPARSKYLGPSLSLSYQQPLHILRGRGQFLYDADGQPFLDCVNNVCHVGHSHPRVVAALANQAAVLNTNTRYLHENIVRLAERLAASLPDELSVCFFVNSGSEANDLALRLARAFTGQRDMLVLEGAYHGNLSSLIEISPYKFDGPGGQGAPEWVHKLPMPCAYRGSLRGTSDPAAGYAAQAGEAIAHLQAAGHGLAGFIAEAIMGTGGQVVFPEGYLAQVYPRVREAGGLCIADEVQIGFGRVGTHFWGFETHGVRPDIVTMGKPFGNGHPLAAVVTTPQIAAAFDTGMEYFNTFGGNPVSCAAGLAVMDVIEDQGLQKNALVVGTNLKAGLEALKARYPLIGDVRGSGLFLGVELVRDRETLDPAPAPAARLVERMRERGVLLSTDGPLHNVIKIKPPMVFTLEDAQRVVEEIATVLDEIED